MEEQQPQPQPQANAQGQGIWDNVKPYSEKVKFEFNEPVLITFPANFTRPQEFPPTSPDGNPFCVFDILAGEDQVESVIMTSSMTMLKNLKTHEPLAGKSFYITKKNVGGKTFYYVEDPETFNTRNEAQPSPDEPKEVTSEHVGIDEQGHL